MNEKTFFEEIAINPRPVVVDLWAPWCGPCRMVKPILENLAREYSGRVDLWQINADENQALLRELGVYAIPTLIVFRDGREVSRQVGAKPANTLKTLFETISTGDIHVPAGLSYTARFLRLGLGLAVASVGWSFGAGWLVIALGALISFSAISDRCPIWRAVTAQLKKMAGGA
ncbi:MAG TPA: thioredoxin [Anaerolineales bacterium]|jgi:thioredoxin